MGFCPGLVRGGVAHLLMGAGVVLAQKYDGIGPRILVASQF